MHELMPKLNEFKINCNFKVNSFPIMVGCYKGHSVTVNSSKLRSESSSMKGILRIFVTLPLLVILQTTHVVGVID